ncbi:xanthine dehydrogenase small subunit [Sphingomonas profundi]|uniref:xanthine dehydrogenase small subunit n=1 Tax=Alterirhizorhabdus profundi TaxID=2681549 RepID=UPI0012E8AE72|nr:xanthine dehydrogenase small subunit [Sphingomonas profundi]
MATVRFLLDGETIALDDPDPTGTVLDLLRYRLRRTGTKEGCAEGDCGACTVLVGALDGDRVAWRAVNACILFLPMLHGKALMTVESLGGTHAVQRELVARHGSQCGFCTPGFVMSLYGRSIGACGTRGLALADVLSGNLCRCTGYGPILDAGAAVPPEVPDDGALAAHLKALATLSVERGRDTPLDCARDTGEPLDCARDMEETRDLAPDAGGRTFHIPATADELAALLLAFPDARIVAGATDVGLWVTKQHRILDRTIFIADIADLGRVAESADGVRIGATVRYAEASAPLARLHPDLGELVRRIAGTQVRNAGTIGGNIANGSPIGDMPPALIALGATLTLRHGDARRTMPLEDYFIGYGVQDRRPGEFVESVFVPRPAAATRIAVTKLSKRFDSDISAVCGAFAVSIEGGVVTAARIAFGGMAGTPARAPRCEAALVDQPWSEATIDAAAAALALDYAPLTDVRGSSGYRLAAAANLLRRLWLADADEPLSVLSPELIDG